jgi:SpoVK/Ycf46/Vps4 family AAA+-type ATPase
MTTDTGNVTPIESMNGTPHAYRPDGVRADPADVQLLVGHRVPLFTIKLDGVITKFMGETAAKLRLIFDAIDRNRGVYLFDEFDAVAGRRAASNDVGEIRRVLNSFLMFLDETQPLSLVIAATNHPELLDPAVFRRFDDVLEYQSPTLELAELALRNHLQGLTASEVDWKRVHGRPWR